MQRRPEKLIPEQSLIGQTRMRIVTISIIPVATKCNANKIGVLLSHAGNTDGNDRSLMAIP
jgi:hypothetical protein